MCLIPSTFGFTIGGCFEGNVDEVVEIRGNGAEEIGWGRPVWLVLAGNIDWKFDVFEADLVGGGGGLKDSGFSTTSPSS